MTRLIDPSPPLVAAAVMFSSRAQLSTRSVSLHREDDEAFCSTNAHAEDLIFHPGRPNLMRTPHAGTENLTLLCGMGRLFGSVHRQVYASGVTPTGITWSLVQGERLVRLSMHPLHASSHYPARHPHQPATPTPPRQCCDPHLPCVLGRCTHSLNTVPQP